MIVPEKSLWVAVLVRAVMDAELNVSKGSIKDAYWHFKWSQSAYFEILCGRAGICPIRASESFKMIYERVSRRDKMLFGGKYRIQDDLFY